MGGNTDSSPAPVPTTTAAILAGSVLAGAILSISIISIPVLVETNNDPTLLLSQWARLYGYGVKIMPASAIATLLLHAFSGITNVRASRPWRVYGVAAATTISIAPFTWLVMAPTNARLFELNAAGAAGAAGGLSLTEVHELLERWRWLNIARSLFPLAGAIWAATGPP
ncbi:Noranthrone monooxygenase [Dichotomopilus funicola]|uniref:Noranthrone monooxygenase n=1 Tax=Dichotomopilus funicola TaxID=1934379 RepID=A0AAN6UVD2_9PEZI|nr:Noranthrone monooxygenase [Dichotomopilus funicola]